MNKFILFICFILPISLFGEDMFTLFERISQSDVYKNQTQTIDATLQNTKASLYNDSWSVGAGVTYADFDDGSNAGAEYQLVIGKDVMLNNSKINKLLKHNSNYSQILKLVKKNQLKALIVRLYGDYCITMDALQAKGELAVVYDTINSQIKKGVELGEFPSNKSIMANLAFQNLILEISKVESQLQDYEAKIKSIVEFDGQFECRSLRPDHNKLFDPKNSAYFNLLQEKKQSALAMLDVASDKAQSLNVNASYTQELDTKRYTVNFSMPLTFDNTQYEAKKASAVHNYSSLTYEIASFKKRYEEETKALKTRLNVYKVHVSGTEESIKLSSDKLIRQSNLRFKAGEESLIEILKATETKLQMIDTILQLKLKRHEAVSNYLYNYAIDPEGVKR